MRAVVQRVNTASVETNKRIISQIQTGLLVLLGVSEQDTADDARYTADKIAGLRIFEDDDGKMNLSVKTIQGSILLVPQFTLYGDCRKGRRPSFGCAARPEQAEELYQEVAARLKSHQIEIQIGAFQQHMHVSSENDGPVTLLIDSHKGF